MKKILIALLTLLLIATPALAAVPEPDSDFYVLDKANVLSSSTEDYIIANNDQLYESCGAQIVFVTVDDTDVDAIDDYCNELFDKWQIGSSKEDNGFLVLMAIDDDNYYALPGVGIEKRMSSGTIKMLLDDYLEPDFADRDYDAGARKLFDALFTEICDMYAVYLTPITGTAASNASNTGSSNEPPRETPSRTTESKSGGGFPIGLIIAIVIVVLIIALPVRSRRRRRGSTVVPPPPPPPHTPPVPPVRPVVVKRKPIIFHTGPRPGTGPRPSSTHRSTIKRSGGGGFSRGGGIGRSGGGGRSISRSGGGGRSRGGGAGRGR